MQQRRLFSFKSSSMRSFRSLSVSIRKKLLYITLFGIAFGYLEAAVVVYLRAIAYPSGFHIPLDLDFPFIHFGIHPALSPVPLKILLTEIGREAATIVMLATLGILAGTTRRERFAFFLLPFAVWGICYYVFLKLLLQWPASLSTIDVLFLIPVPWLAPVWLPLLCSLLMLIISLMLLKTDTSPLKHLPAPNH